MLVTSIITGILTSEASTVSAILKAFVETGLF